MSTTYAAPAAPSDGASIAEHIATDSVRVDAQQVLDLAQQGYFAFEIADRLRIRPRDAEQALETLIPGDFRTVRSALLDRFRAWRRRTRAEGWLDAEHAFGIAHANILRVVGAPQSLPIPAQDPAEAGYLDAVLAGVGCTDDRALLSARAYAMGATLQELGDRFELTRERIRQLLSLETPWSSTAIGAAVRLLGAERRDEQKRAVEQWSMEHPAEPLSSAVRALGMSEAQVHELLGRRRTHHVPLAPRASHRRSDEDILQDLREYHRRTGLTTAAGFTDWAREQGVPGHQTVAIRFGTWNDALRVAGLRTVVGAPRSSFTDEDLWAAIIALVRAADGGTSARRAEEWLKSRPAAPSFALIRQRIGISWAEASAEALAVVRGESDRDPLWIAAVTAERDWNQLPEPIDDLQHIRDAIAELGRHLSLQRYSGWAKENRRPAGGTLIRRCGKQWSELLLEAGGTRNRSRWTN
ncbi:MAG: homing endonuclease associated repeat-containing protein [Brachybacterium tyrofermentans]